MTIHIRTTTKHTISCCHCTDSITVENLNIEPEEKGWRIESNIYPIKIENIRDIKCPVCFKKEYDEKYNGDFESRLHTEYYYEKGHNFYTDLAKYLEIENHPKLKIFMGLIREKDDSWHTKFCYANELYELIK
jgi:hypothetical protein